MGRNADSQALGDRAPKGKISAEREKGDGVLGDGRVVMPITPDEDCRKQLNNNKFAKVGTES